MLAICVAIVGGVVLLILYVIRRKDEVEQLQAALALMTAGAKVDGLTAEKTARKTQLRDNDIERKKLDVEIAIAKRKAVAIVKDVEGMDEVDVAIEYRKLGY